MCLAHSVCHVREWEGRNTEWALLAYADSITQQPRGVSKAAWVLNVRAGIRCQSDTGADTLPGPSGNGSRVHLPVPHSRALGGPAGVIFVANWLSGGLPFDWKLAHYPTSTANTKLVFPPPCFSFRACFCFFSLADGGHSDDWHLLSVCATWFHMCFPCVDSYNPMTALWRRYYYYFISEKLQARRGTVGWSRVTELVSGWATTRSVTRGRNLLLPSTPFHSLPRLHHTFLSSVAPAHFFWI